MTRLALPDHIVTFDLPTGTELDLSEAPMSGGFGFGGDRWVFFFLTLANLSDSAPHEIDIDAFAQALDEDENLTGVATDRGSVFADVLMIERDSAQGGPTGRWFLRMDRLDNGVIRILKVAPGRAEGESDAERAEKDGLAFAVAEGARESPAHSSSTCRAASSARCRPAGRSIHQRRSTPNGKGTAMAL